ncbi:MAG: HD-GYP domain-containing protein [Firmicutes bacterium]|nr:HD-GYP domain-containing protein [Bacillota bacterium]MDH7496630.1 HD-GYP domain-containing protein [Bacillota bacterium]
MLEQIVAELGAWKRLGPIRKRDLLVAVAALVDIRCPFTAAHSTRVGTYSEIIAQEMGLIPSIQKSLRLAGLVHDIGKIGVPKALLQKSGILTEAESAEIRKHPLLSYDIVSDVPGLLAIANIVLFHHERWDGHGYPYGIRGEEIPLGSRILCVADSFDAMISERPYRPAVAVSDALRELERCAGTQFDPDVVQCFKSYVQQRGLKLSPNATSKRSTSSLDPKQPD